MVSSVSIVWGSMSDALGLHYLCFIIILLPFVSEFLVFGIGPAQQTAIVTTTKNDLREKTFILVWKLLQKCTGPESRLGVEFIE